MAAVVVLAAGTAFGIHRVREQDRLRYESSLREEVAGQKTDRLRRAADARLAVGLGVARAGDVDAAIHSLSETVGFCRQSEARAAQHDEAAEHVRQLEWFKTFRAKAAAVL